MNLLLKPRSSEKCGVLCLVPMGKIGNFLLLLGLMFITAGPVYADLPLSGDLNGDEQIDMADAILALQVLTNANKTGIRTDFKSSGVDVNGDSRIGIEEVIYILQRLTGFRPFTPANVPGSLVFPAGTTITPDTLTVMTARGMVPVTPDGTFQAFGLREGPVLMVARTAEGTPILFGWTGDSRPLSARTTAEVIVFYAMGFVSFPTDALNAMREALANTTEIDSFADIIASEIANNPNAFSTYNANMAQGLKDLRAVFAVRKPNSVLVNPGTEQSGLTVNIASGINQIEIANRFIRPAYAYLEQTGYQRAADHQEVEEVKSVQEFEISSVKGFNGTIGSLLDYFSNQQQAFAQITTGPFSLPMAGGAETTHFRLAIVGPGTGAGQPMTAEQAEKYKDLCADYVVTQVVIPILANVFVPFSSPLSQKQLTVLLTADNVLQDFLGVINTTVPEMWTAIENHDLNAAMTAVMNAIATSNAFRQALANVIIKALGQQMFPSAATMASHMLAAITTVDAVGTVISTIISTGNVYLAYPCDVWILNATTPKVTLTPQEQTVPLEDYGWFEAHVPELSDSLPQGAVIHYRWSTAGSFGKLVNPDTGQSDTSFETAYNRVSYLAGKQEGTDAIGVEAILVQGTARENLGTATASVHVVAMRRCENRSYNFKYETSEGYGYVMTVLHVWKQRPGEYSHDIYEYSNGIGGYSMTLNSNNAISNRWTVLSGVPISYFNLADDELAMGGGRLLGWPIPLP